MANNPPRPTRKSIEEARQRANAEIAAQRAERRRKASGGISYAEANWAKLSPLAQAKVNKLRALRDQKPLSPAKPIPKEYVAPPARIQARDPNDDREAIAAALEFLGYGDQAEEWKKIAKRLAIERAHDQLDTQKPGRTKRELKTEMLWRVIAKFVDAAQSAPKEKRWPRKQIIGYACHYFGVGRSTVEDAIKQYRKEFHFTDGSKLSPAKRNSLD